MKRFFLLIAFLGAQLLAIPDSYFSFAQSPAPPIQRIVVKFRSSLATSVESALPLQQMYLTPGMSGSPQVESFLARYAAKKVAPLYPGTVRVKKIQGLSDFQIATQLRQQFALRGNRNKNEFHPPELSRTYVLELSPTSNAALKQTLAALNADPNVEFAEEDRIFSINSTTNDPYLSSSGTWGQTYPDLWGILKIGAVSAWDTSKGDGIVVAVVDTGLDYNHPDIAANVWTNPGEIAGNGVDDDHNGFIDDTRGWDFVGATYTNPVQSNDPIDHQGHGTHVAGTIAAVGNNGIGVIGVAWHAKVMPVKALDDHGQGPESALAPAIQYAANNGADIISASWGGSAPSQAIADAIDFAYSLGVVIVVAAGNSSEDALNFYPAALPDVITVAATDPNDNLASFSNFGSKIDVAAPGVDILSLQAEGTNLGTEVAPGYTRANGTSMATPHVSGLAALILSQHPNYTNEDVRQVLRNSAADLGASGFDLQFGYGRINAANALSVPAVLEARILSPAGNTQVIAPTVISGFARGTTFTGYVLEYGSGTLPTTWTTFQTSSTPVANGSLGTFDATAVADGQYTIRLTVFSSTAATFTDRILVQVHGNFITRPAPPRAPTSATSYKNGEPIFISGSATGVNFQHYILEWAPGLNPSSGFQTTGITLLNSGGTQPTIDKGLGIWETHGITQAGFYTIRMTVTASSSTTTVLTMVYLQPDLLSTAWPHFLFQGPYFSSGVVPAANADGTQRLVLSSPNNGFELGHFWTFLPNGDFRIADLPGFGAFHQPSVADLDGQPGEEVIASNPGAIQVFHEDGTSTAFTLDPSIDLMKSQEVIEDLDGDSQFETIASGDNYTTHMHEVYAWRPNGNLLNGNFPLQVSDLNDFIGWYNRQRLLVGDFNGDGKKEIVVWEGLSSNTFTLRLFSNSGLPLTWNVPTLTGIPFAMVAADLDHNNKLETILAAYNGNTVLVHVFQPDGTERAGWPYSFPSASTTNQIFLAVADLSRDGNYEIVLSHETELYVFNANGALFPGSWPLTTPSPGFGAVVIGDVNGDGAPEIVVTRTDSLSTADPFFINGSHYYSHNLLAINKSGVILNSWQLTGMDGYDEYVYPLPSIEDFNQDGITDIAVAYEVTGSPTSVPGVLTIINTGASFNPALNDWPLSHQNARNNSILQSSLNSTTSTLTAATANPTSSVTGQSIALTVTVKATLVGAAIPGGAVNFLEGGTIVGSCVLAGATCSANVTTFSAGTHTLTAAYLGDAHSTISFSLPFVEAVGVADFSLSASAAQTVNAGAAASYTITVSPNPAPYNFAVQNLTCTGLPKGTQCSFNPISVTPGGTATTIALTLTTTSRILVTSVPLSSFRDFWPGFGFLVLVAAFAVLICIHPTRQPKHAWGPVAFLVLCAYLASCGGGGSSGGGTQPNPNGTPAGNYTITITANNNEGAVRTTTVNLNVN
jgi:subtilisin family serine protease